MLQKKVLKIPAFKKWFAGLEGCLLNQAIAQRGRGLGSDRFHKDEFYKIY
ncbi:hypothetical protein [Coleofasciculus sp. FACHB-1120]|nr:hypothetical protein [Coleofasciculus sp. FACHB-1120]MBD2744356.1 hypothetical protein [Coleofasciculus sp. FACHB-1120]